MAYCFVISLAFSSYLLLSDLYNLAISPTSGSSGLGSVSNDVNDRSTFVVVRAGDH